jgi:excisionase family DNA binding protein
MANLPAEQKRILSELWTDFRHRQPEPGSGVLLRAREACKLLGLARHQLQLMVNRGRIASFRRGSARLIPLDALEAFARSWRGKGSWHPGKAWSQPEDALLGTVSDSEAAARLGRSYNEVRWRRLKLGKGAPSNPMPPRHVFTPEEDALLGTMSDRALAKMLGHSRSIVIHRRKKLGISTFSVRRRMGRSWTPEEDALLGTLSDAQLALKLGRTRADVLARRAKLSVPSYGSKPRYDP